MKILKVSLIVVGSVLAIVGAILLGLFFTGGFEPKVIPPENVFFAQESVDEEGNKIYIERTSSYDVDKNFDIILSSSTEEYNQLGVNLEFNSKTDIINYLQLDAEAEREIIPFATLDNEGNLKKYKLADKKEEATHITNGKIVVPVKVYLDKAFTVELCVAPDNMNYLIFPNLSLYNVGGTTKLFAQSDNKDLSKISTTINIDVPVSEIEIIPTTSNGGTEFDLGTTIENDTEYHIVNLDSYFAARVKFVPERSAYVYGNSENLKQVIFGLTNDEQNITLVDAEGNEINTVSNLARFKSLASGKGQIFARVYQNSLLEIENSNLSLIEKYRAMENVNVGKTASANISISQVAISGFGVNNNVGTFGSEVQMSVNNKLIVLANNASLGDINLGLNIVADGYSQGAIQTEIKNIYLSVQVLTDLGWVDATKGENTYFTVNGLSKLTINNEQSAFNTFDFYQIMFNANLPNSSFWEIVPTTLNEGANYSGIRFVVMYNSAAGFVENNSSYGPYYFNAIVKEPVVAEVEWNSGDLLTSEELVVGENNNRTLFYTDGNAVPININLINLAKITNLNSKPVHTLVKFFVYSTDKNLSNKINCKPYSGKIEGVPNGVSVYELLDNEKLTVSSMESVSQYQFSLFFAVVKNDALGNAIIDEGNYIVTALPLNEGGMLEYIPFNITKTISFDNNSLVVEQSATAAKINPYRETEPGIFVLQRETKNLILHIFIDSNDEEIFKNQVRLGNISLTAICNDASFTGLYYTKEGSASKISIENCLAVAIENIVSEKSGDKQLYSIPLSTDNIDFANDEAEKVVNIRLTYNIVADNIPEEITNPVVINSSSFRIYSGKTINYYYGFMDGNAEEILNPAITTIYVKKEVSGNEFTTKYYIDNEYKDEITLLNDGNLVILSDRYGIKDSISLTCSDNSILEINSSTVKGELVYQISPLKSGEATITIKPDYPHPSIMENGSVIGKTLTFKINSNFTIANGFENEETSGVGNAYVTGNKNGVISYENGIYTFIGAPITKSGDNFTINDVGGYVYNFNELIKIYVNEVIEGNEVTQSLNFSINNFDNSLEKYVEIVKTNGKTTGFKLKAKLGMPASFTVYYYSNELGYSNSININLAPYYKASVSLENHAGATIKTENIVAGTKFVFAEVEIPFTNFNVFGYDLDSKTYTAETSLSLNYLLQGVDNTVTLQTTWNMFTDSDGNHLAAIKIDDNKTDDTADDVIKLIFAPVAKEKAISLSVYDESATDNYKFKVDFNFYVYPNVKLEGNTFKEESTEKIFYLNTLETAFKNGNKINWGANEITNDVNNVFTILFGRYLQGIGFGEVFDKSFGYYVCLESENSNTSDNLDEFTYTPDSSYTISGVKKLSLYNLFIEYGEVCFHFRYYAKPAITDPNTITYNNVQYVPLYVGEKITDQKIIDDKLITTSEDSKVVKSMADIASVLENKESIVVLDGYKLYGDTPLTLRKNDQSLFETYVVFEDGADGEDGEVGYVVYPALIFPAEWEYIKYDTSQSDVYKILTGDFEIPTTESGQTISHFADNILNKGTYSYNIYSITNKANEKLQNSNEFLTVNTTSHEIETNPMGKAYKFRIDFTVTLEGNYNYKFSYFISIKPTQEITVNYPFIDEASEKNPVHKIYYSDQFEKIGNDNTYSLDLKSKVMNLFGNTYVELKNNDNLGNANELQFAIESVTVNNALITENVGEYAKVENGIVTLKQQSIFPMFVKVKIYTNTGAESYFNILASEKTKNYVLGTESGNENIEFTLSSLTKSELKGENNYDLSNIELFEKSGANLSPVTDLTLKFAFVNDNGILQTSDNLIYVEVTTGDDGVISTKLVVKPSPNTQTGKLIAFTKEGIVKIIDVEIESDITISQNPTGYANNQNDDHAIWADQTINLKNYLIVKNGTVNPVTQYNASFTLTQGSDFCTLSEDSLSLTVKPTTKGSEKFEVEITYTIYGNNLPGTSITDGCTGTLTFTILPNVVVNNAETTVEANNNGLDSVNINQLFTITNNDTGYTYKVTNITKNLSEAEQTRWKELNIVDSEIVKIISTHSTEPITQVVITTGPVASVRTIVATIIITKEDDDFSETATLTITVEPDVNVEVNYPTYGTAQTMQSHLIYCGDYYNGGTLDILSNLTFEGENGSTTKALESTDVNLITISDNKLTIVSTVTQTTQVAIQVLVDGLVRENYILTISHEPVFTAKFDNGTNTKTEDLIASDITADKNPFDINDGTLSVTTAANRADKTFTLVLVAKDRRTGMEYRVDVKETGTTDKQTITYDLKDLFAGTGCVDCLDMCDIWLEDYSEQVGVDGIFESVNSVKLTLPTQTLTFFFNGYKIPFAVANAMFEVGGQNLSTFELNDSQSETSSNYITYLSTTPLATYSYKVVLDYAFAEDAFDTLIKEVDNKNTEDAEDDEIITTINKITENSYADDEFNTYTIPADETKLNLFISKTLELKAGESYDLIELLTKYLGLTSRAGGNYGNSLNISLVAGDYNTNVNYRNNLSALISFTAKTETEEEGSNTISYTITPHGARNNGDIVHLTLKFGNETKTYVLRIKILPSISIKNINSSGVYPISYGTQGGVGGANANNAFILNDASGNLYNIPITNLVNVSGIDISKLIVAVGNGSRYVAGDGFANRLTQFRVGEDSYYGIQLKKTIFGGNTIELTISDKFGYFVSAVIKYYNEDSKSPDIMYAPTTIYEGESFKLAFYLGEESNPDPAKDGQSESVYALFDGAWIKKFESELEVEGNIIKIDNFAASQSEVLFGLLATINDTIVVKTSPDITKPQLTSNKTGLLTPNSLSIGYLNSQEFNGAITLSESAVGFALTLTVGNADLGTGATESVTLSVPTALNQKYQIRAKDPYNKESTLYFGFGNTYEFSKVFEVYDLQDGVTISAGAVEITSIIYGLSNDNNDWLNVSSGEIITTGSPSFTNKLSSSQTTTFTITLTINGDKVEHTIVKDVKLTPKYYAVQTPDTYNVDYGKVVTGVESTGNITNGTWFAGFTMLDYYGRVIADNDDSIDYPDISNVTFDKAEGNGTLSSGTLSGLSPDSPITINVLSNEQVIGTIRVTLARYYGLTGGNATGNTIDTTNTLNFEVWASGVKALVVGDKTGKSEDLPSGISLFSFSTTTGYDIIFTDGQYKLHKTSGNFASGEKIEVEVTVKYLGEEIGTITVTVDADGTVTTDISTNS